MVRAHQHEGIDAALLLEAMTEPLPETGPSPEHASLGWQVQVGCSLKCISERLWAVWWNGKTALVFFN